MEKSALLVITMHARKNFTFDNAETPVVSNSIGFLVIFTLKRSHLKSCFSEYLVFEEGVVRA